MAEVFGGLKADIIGNAPTVTLPTEAATQLFRQTAIKYSDMQARQLGLYADVNLGRNLKARFASMTTPQSLLRSRANGCTWNPRGGVRLNIQEFDTCPVDYQGEQCPDAFYETCFETIFEGGRTDDILATAEGQRVMAEMLQSIGMGLGNSFNALYHFAKHPLIEQANTSGNYRADADSWADYYAQQMDSDCGGLITQLDGLKETTEFARYYNTEIAKGASGINTTTGKFDGDIMELLSDLRSKASAELQIAMDAGVTNGTTTLKPVVLLSNDMFNAYQDYIRSLASGSDLAYRYLFTGTDGINTVNALQWNGLPVIRWEACTHFDAFTGYRSYRAAIVAPNQWGVIGNIDAIPNGLFNNQGLVVQRSPLVQDLGKIYMYLTFRWGAAIADPKMGVMASTVIDPA